MAHEEFTLNIHQTALMPSLSQQFFLNWDLSLPNFFFGHRSDLNGHHELQKVYL
jgi:hypothetical protein